MVKQLVWSLNYIGIEAIKVADGQVSARSAMEPFTIEKFQRLCQWYPNAVCLGVQNLENSMVDSAYIIKVNE